MSTVGPAPRLAELSARLSRCPDLDTLVGAALDGLAALFGYEHSLLLLLDEDGTRLYTIASHGYPVAGIGSEVRVGEGVIGMAAARVEPMRVGNLGSMLAYTRTQRRAHEQHGGEAPGTEIPLPGLATAYVAGEGLATINPDGSDLTWAAPQVQIEHQPDWARRRSSNRRSPRRTGAARRPGSGSERKPCPRSPALAVEDVQAGLVQQRTERQPWDEMRLDLVQDDVGRGGCDGQVRNDVVDPTTVRR